MKAVKQTTPEVQQQRGPPPRKESGLGFRTDPIFSKSWFETGALTSGLALSSDSLLDFSSSPQNLLQITGDTADWSNESDAIYATQNNNNNTEPFNMSSEMGGSETMMMHRGTSGSMSAEMINVPSIEGPGPPSSLPNRTSRRLTRSNSSPYYRLDTNTLPPTIEATVNLLDMNANASNQTVNRTVSSDDFVRATSLHTVKSRTSCGQAGKIAKRGDGKGKAKAVKAAVADTVQEALHASSNDINPSLLENPLLAQYLSSPALTRMLVSQLQNASQAPPQSAGATEVSLRSLGHLQTIGAGKRRGRKPNPSSPNDRPFICPHAHCGYGFPTQFSLKRHFKRHSGQKPFACTHQDPITGEPCAMRFAEKSTLKRHLQMHEGNKPHTCTYSGCDRSFADRVNLNRHLEKHTERKAGKSQLKKSAN